MTTAERIRYYRKQSGLTLEQVAEELGVQTSAISKYEKETVTNIPLNRIKQLAKVLGVPPQNLIDWGEEIDEEKESLAEMTYKLPSRLKSRRKELGLTLLDIAKRVGISEGTVQRWECGSIKMLRYENMVKLAKALDTTPAYLMGWDEEEKHESLKKMELHRLIDEVPDDLDETIELILKLPRRKLEGLASLIMPSENT